MATPTPIESLSPQTEPQQSIQPLDTNGDTTQFLAHSGEDNKLADIEAKSSRIISIGTKILAAGLTLQSLYHIYQSIYFVFIKVPVLEMSLTAGLLDRDQVVLLAVKAIIQISTAILSMFFALRLNIVSKKAAKQIDMAIAVALFFGNAFIIDFFRSIEVDLVLTDITQHVIAYFADLPLRLISLIPFL